MPGETYKTKGAKNATANEGGVNGRKKISSFGGGVSFNPIVKEGGKSSS